MVDRFTILKALYPMSQPARPGQAGQNLKIVIKHLEIVEHFETIKTAMQIESAKHTK